MTIEERITRLEDIEKIRCLQARYQRCLDTRAFDELAECFTEDVVSAYGNGTMSYKGKEELMNFLTDVMTLDMPSTHLIHGGEIEVLDSSNAVGKWYLEDHLLHQKYKVKLHGAAIYDISYRKEDGIWKICSIGYERCYEHFELRGLVNILTLKKTTFLDSIRRPLAKGGRYTELFKRKHGYKG